MARYSVSRKQMRPKMRAFAKAYVWGEHAGVGSKCAEAVGYSTRDARDRAYTLLRHPLVKALVEAESAEKERQLKGKAARIADEVYRLATADLGELYDDAGNLLPIGKMPEDARRALAGVEVDELFEGRGAGQVQTGVTRKVKLHDKRAAQELFLKYAGKLKDKVEHSGTVAMSVVDPYAEPPAKE